MLTQDRRERLGVERQVLGIGLVAVQHGGDVAVATGAAGRALAELGADCGFEKVGVGHDLIYSYGSSGLVNGGARNVGALARLVYSSGEDNNEDGRKPSRVDHGVAKSAVTLAETT
ncbi:hypothetical protein FMUAM8_48580 [Nocardia cyriacigeorgica]|nr:hypothetical protein FMUAM8_48580 [Nocardia cyriacigeorgica]BDU08509.1 hypothetical protein FMUBM48_47720 [Nocardia cyriacigeorgica]